MKFVLFIALLSLIGYYNLSSIFSAAMSRAKPSAEASLGFLYMISNSKYETGCIREANSADVSFKIRNLIKDGFFHCANIEIYEAAHLLNAAVTSTYVPKQAAVPVEIINQTTNLNDNLAPQCLKFANEIQNVCPLTWSDASRYRGL